MEKENGRTGIQLLRWSYPLYGRMLQEKNQSYHVYPQETTEIARKDPTSSVSPQLISTRCMLLLKVALVAYHHYTPVERSITPSNRHYTKVLCTFNQEREELISLLKGYNPDVPVLLTNVTPIKWL